MPGFLAEVLTWPNNYGFTIAVQTAMELQLPPTVLLTDKQPTEGWSRADKKLAIAWTILKKETCNQCGQPLWICRSSNKNLTFSVRKGVCYAKAELDKWEKKNGKDLKPGEAPYVMPKMYNGNPVHLENRRMTYLQEQADE